MRRQNITLIATTHSENGLCNLKELLKIFNNISPNCIFEELSQQIFSKIYNNELPNSLETSTIKSYLEGKATIHIPVDVDGNLLIDKILKNSIYEMFEIFDSNFEYQKYKIELNTLTQRIGFKYLNSEQCEFLLAEKYFLEQKIAQSHSEKNLNLTHQKWIKINDFRESKMISKIYEYSETNNFNNAIFLIGAEHRKPIIDKINDFQNRNITSINWNLKYFE